MPRLLPLLTATLLAPAALATPAAAAPGYEVGVADDRLLFASPESAAQAVAEWREAGVDTVRVFARWGAHAPAETATRMPGGFTDDDHDDPGYDWGRLDWAIGAVTGGGMKVALTVTGWGPVWGSEFPVRRNPRYKPSPGRFANFATAVATRYGGLVDQYVVWNEPNIAQWMQPQSQCSARGRCTPFAPHQYRRIVREAEPAIRAADPGARIMLGALAPRGTSGGSANANLRPLAFLRAFGCVSGRYRRVRSGACRGFRPARGDLLAYHPHGLKRSPTQRDPVRDQAQLADLGRLTSAVDRIQRAGGIKVRGASRFPLYLDEYAYQTRPPDRVLGVSNASQAAWLQQSASIAWRHPRVRGLTWYVWRDEPVGRAGSGWQSGMRTVDGTAKPALRVFPRPLWVRRTSRRSISVWGQVRPGDAHEVTLERRSGSRWVRVATIRTDTRGAFRRTVAARTRQTFRFRDDTGATSASRTVR